MKVGAILVPGIENEDLREVIEKDFIDDAADKLVISPMDSDND